VFEAVQKTMKKNIGFLKLDISIYKQQGMRNLEGRTMYLPEIRDNIML
jgi:hypothetical protein